MSGPAAIEHEAIIIGAGMAGVYQLHRLRSMGFDAIALDGNAGVGGTWFNNRYPGCRFDSESISYGYFFSKEIIDAWNWKEAYSSQPDNLNYVEFVVEKLGLQNHISLNKKVVSAAFDEPSNTWTLHVADGSVYRCRFLITAIGLLSVPTAPKYAGMSDFAGQQFHTFNWPHEGVDLKGKRVAVIGTGATGIQVISAIAAEVSQLYVLQRRPHWGAPLNNHKLSDSDMRNLRAEIETIKERCQTSLGGFLHNPVDASFYDQDEAERKAFWDRLYDEPGFGVWMGNYKETLVDEKANAEFSEYIASRIRQRVRDPKTAEKLIPRDHGFGVQRVPLETKYYEVYNQPNVRLVDIEETPIERVIATGIRTSHEDLDVDVIVYATGFDAVTGAFDRIDFRGVGGKTLAKKWADGPETFLGMMTSDFPNLLMAAGPQSGSAASNYPRGIEATVNWCSDLLQFARDNGVKRFEASKQAEDAWGEHVRAMYSAVLMRKARSWFTGFNSNIAGRTSGPIRYFMYNGGLPRYSRRIRTVQEGRYQEIDFTRGT